MQPTRSYLICTTPRSGGTLLCELLTLSGRAGTPNEWFLPSAAPIVREVFDIAATFDDAAYLPAILEETSTANGIFGAKLMWPHMQAMLDGASPWFDRPLSVPLHVDGPFPNLRYVHLVREDDLQQAISLLLATRTNNWQRIKAERSGEASANWVAGALRLGFGEQRYLLSEDDQPTWPLADMERDLADPILHGAIMAEIEGHRDMLREQHAAWLAFFAREGVTPLTIHYEDLAAGPETEAARVLRFLGLEARLEQALAASRVIRLGDARNALLARAYRAGRGAV